MSTLNYGLRRLASWGRSPSMNRQSSRRDRRFRPMVGPERLEPRLALSHTTIQVGAVLPGRDPTFTGSLERNSSSDYMFQVTGPIIVGATLSGLSSNAELVLLNSDKMPLATFSNGRANDSFTYTFSPGVYYARVFGLGRHKAHYQIALTVTALPAPESATPPASAGASSPPASNNPAPQQGTTVTAAEFASALWAQINTSVTQFLTDSSTIEVDRPTLGSQAIDPQLVQIDDDLKNGQILNLFSDFQTLGKSLIAEAEVSVAYGGSALLGSSQILQDLVAVGQEKQWTYAFVLYLAANTQYHATSPTPATTMLGTGLIAPNSSGDNSSPLVSQSDQSVLNSSTPSLEDINYMDNIELGRLDSFAQFDAAADGFYADQDDTPGP
jgi:hypothetical protein